LFIRLTGGFFTWCKRGKGGRQVLVQKGGAGERSLFRKEKYDYLGKRPSCRRVGGRGETSGGGRLKGEEKVQSPFREAEEGMAFEKKGVLFGGRFAEGRVAVGGGGSRTLKSLG